VLEVLAVAGMAIQELLLVRMAQLTQAVEVEEVVTTGLYIQPKAAAPAS
jgi:hypothetical protein